MKTYQQVNDEFTELYASIQTSSGGGGLVKISISTDFDVDQDITLTKKQVKDLGLFLLGVANGKEQSK